MTLDRNINLDGRGKYALLLLRNLPSEFAPSGEVHRALEILRRHNILDLGNTPDSEFFVIRLKDENAAPALLAYAHAAHEHGDSEFAQEVGDLAAAALHHPSRKKPD